MGIYSGCIIEESLKDKSILDEFKIVDTDDGSYIVELDDKPVAMCALEELSALPQITPYAGIKTADIAAWSAYIQSLHTEVKAISSS